MSFRKATANKITREYFDCLRILVNYAQKLESEDEVRRMSMACVIMSITIVEAFLNLYFRQLIEQEKFKDYREKTLDELDSRVTLEHKIKKWPLRFFKTEIDFGKGIGKRFAQLKELRNHLMHFKHTFETINFDDVVIHGLTDVEKYDQLNKQIAENSIFIAEDFLAEIFRMQGLDKNQIAHRLHLWIGKVPDYDLKGQNPGGQNSGDIYQIGLNG